MEKYIWLQLFCGFCVRQELPALEQCEEMENDKKE